LQGRDGATGDGRGRWPDTAGDKDGQMKTILIAALIAASSPALAADWWVDYTDGGCARASFSPAQIYESYQKSGHHADIREFFPGVVVVTPDVGVDFTFPFYNSQAVCEKFHDGLNAELDHYR
jgi:hypothetical protein